jgi:hypothetical protein
MRVKELIRRAAAPAATTTLAPQPAAIGQSSPAPPKTVDDYFERLDAAFAERTAARQSAAPEDVGTVPTLESVLQPDRPQDQPAATPAPIVSDALVDEVTRRVAERLGTTALREVTADVVADVAERLIREEIVRIRSKT